MIICINVYNLKVMLVRKTGKQYKPFYSEKLSGGALNPAIILQPTPPPPPATGLKKSIRLSVTMSPCEKLDYVEHAYYVRHIWLPESSMVKSLDDKSVTVCSLGMPL